MGTLFSKADKDAVEERYSRLKTRNIKHFPNPRTGDTNLSTAEKATRTRTASRSARSRSTAPQHLDAIGLAMSAGQLGDQRLLGEAIAMDAFACHFLTDMFSASHTRTPRSSIEAYWDKKVPNFDDRLVKWLADEVVFAIHRDPSGVAGVDRRDRRRPLRARALGRRARRSSRSCPRSASATSSGWSSTTGRAPTGRSRSARSWRSRASASTPSATSA